MYATLGGELYHTFAEPWFCSDGGEKRRFKRYPHDGNGAAHGQIKVTKGCVDAVRGVFPLPLADDGARDVPVKENDHAMDDIRYFVSTVLGAGESFACAVQRRRGKELAFGIF